MEIHISDVFIKQSVGWIAKLFKPYKIKWTENISIKTGAKIKRRVLKKSKYFNEVHELRKFYKDMVAKHRIVNAF